jgi:radical SAM superfamily enzyme YgiQ (UPF0313 family)
MHRFNWDLKEVSSVMGKRTVGHPLALPLLAALTPSHYDIRIIDEELEPIPPNIAPDIVGITGLISNIRRGFELADIFRARGVPVVMGGPQVSFNVEESLTHSDAVVVGEAENVWEQVLSDFETGIHRRVYESGDPCTFVRCPMPRWDLLDTSKLLTFSVQVSRGCPHRCDFCLVRKLSGPVQRYRDIDNVILEIESLPPGAQIAFADDNLTADKRYARELMQRLIPLHRAWSCQASLDVARDERFLKLMSEAGCNSILIGFESLNNASLEEAKKPQNRIAEYRDAVENIHRAGIHVLGSFVVGFDSDTSQSFEQIQEFVEETSVTLVMINALSVYPGTDLYYRMKEEGRITRINTDLCNGLYPTMQYRNITQTEMFLGILDTLDRIYSFKSLCVRGPEALGNGSFVALTEPPISRWVKLRAMGHVFFRYFLSTNRFQRRLLFRLVELIRKKRLSIGAMMQYLLFVSSIRGYLKFNRRQSRAILKELALNDSLAESPGGRASEQRICSRVATRVEEHSSIGRI